MFAPVATEAQLRSGLLGLRQPVAARSSHPSRRPRLTHHVRPSSGFADTRGPDLCRMVSKMVCDSRCDRPPTRLTAVDDEKNGFERTSRGAPGRCELRPGRADWRHTRPGRSRHRGCGELRHRASNRCKTLVGAGWPHALTSAGRWSHGASSPGSTLRQSQGRGGRLRSNERARRADRHHRERVSERDSSPRRSAGPVGATRRGIVGGRYPPCRRCCDIGDRGATRGRSGSCRARPPPAPAHSWPPPMTLRGCTTPRRFRRCRHVGSRSRQEDTGSEIRRSDPPSGPIGCGPRRPDCSAQHRGRDQPNTTGVDDSFGVSSLLGTGGRPSWCARRLRRARRVWD